MVSSINGNSSSANNNNNSSSSSSSYTVKKGDTLSEIANRQGVGLNQLIKANPQIKDPNMIMPGQQIQMPTGNQTGNLDGLRVSRAQAPSEGPPANGGILREGSRGPAVRQLQEALADKGFNPGAADGVFGSRTEAALKSFQSSRGIPADGVYGPQTRDAFSKPAVNNGGGSAPRPRTSGGGQVDTPVPSNGKGSVSYNGKTVSDKTLRNKIEQVADFFGRHVTVTSGDRDFVPKGGSQTSLHLAHRAIDLHVDGVPDAQVFSRLKESGLLNGGYEVILHGPNTATGGPHVHIGRYADGRASQFKLEGVPGRARSGQYVRV